MERVSARQDAEQLRFPRGRFGRPSCGREFKLCNIKGFVTESATSVNGRVELVRTAETDAARGLRLGEPDRFHAGWEWRVGS